MIQTAGLTNHYAHGNVEMEEIQLSERERIIAKEAAKIALQELSGEFYKQVGKTVVEKVLIWIGLLVVGFVVGKGWLIKI